MHVEARMPTEERMGTRGRTMAKAKVTTKAWRRGVRQRVWGWGVRDRQTAHDLCYGDAWDSSVLCYEDG